MFDETGCDAVMIGRAAIGNPWIFRRSQSYLKGGVDPGPPSLAEQIGLFYDLLHATALEKGEYRAVGIMRKHLAKILKGLPNIASLRAAALREKTIPGLRRRLEPLAERSDIKEACA
jgi:tRNA-dihydrouridine synthase